MTTYYHGLLQPICSDPSTGFWPDDDELDTIDFALQSTEYAIFCSEVPADQQELSMAATKADRYLWLATHLHERVGERPLNWSMVLDELYAFERSLVSGDRP